MILTEVGELSAAQDLTAGATQSENIIDMTALGIDGPQPASPLFLDIECETVATGDSSDTFVFDLIASDNTTINTGTQGTNYFKLITADILNYEDPRIATAGEKILSVKLPNQIRQLARNGFRYLGILSTVSSGATVSINAAIVLGEPETEHNVQVVRSNVGVPT